MVAFRVADVVRFSTRPDGAHPSAALVLSYAFLVTRREREDDANMDDEGIESQKLPRESEGVEFHNSKALSLYPYAST